jgi:hypothetical protein
LLVIFVVRGSPTFPLRKDGLYRPHGIP